MPFYVSKANSAGLRLSSADTMLQPGPTYVTYPSAALGTILETADGSPVMQQPNKDGRVRKWTWVGYRSSVAGYTNLWDLLLSLRSRSLKQAGALTPYVYLKEDVTGRLARRVNFIGTATATGVNTLTDSGKNFGGTNALAGFKIVIIDGKAAGQRGTITLSNATQVTISSNWIEQPSTSSKYEIVGWSSDYFKCRVIDVSRKLKEEGTNPPIFDETTLTFVIEDAAYNDIG